MCAFKGSEKLHVLGVFSIHYIALLPLRCGCNEITQLHMGGNYEKESFKLIISTFYGSYNGSRLW